MSLASPALAGGFFTTAAPGKPTLLYYFIRIGNNLLLLKDGWIFFFLVDQWEPGTEYVFLKTQTLSSVLTSKWHAFLQIFSFHECPVALLITC